MKRFNNNRGVEPIIAGLLLLILTIFAFSMTYMATSRWISTQRLGPMLALRERLVIEDVWFKTNGTGKFVCVYIRNVGNIQLDIYSLRVNEAVPPGLAPKKLFLQVGFGGWMNASYSTWVVGMVYKIEVFTDRGSVMTTYATA